MESKARALGHPIHPVLIVFPLGLLSTAVIFDLLRMWTGDGKWSNMAEYLIGAGVIGGVVAGVFGAIDWWAIPRNTRAKTIGLLHGVGNVIVLLLFAASWVLRLRDLANPSAPALSLSFLGLLLASVTGWLGGELVDRLGVGVSDDADLNSPSSLRAP